MSRVYFVTDNHTGTRHLVEADSQHQAIGMVVSGRYTASPAAALEVMSAIQDGVQVLRKTPAQAPQPEQPVGTTDPAIA